MQKFDCPYLFLLCRYGVGEDAQEWWQTANSGSNRQWWAWWSAVPEMPLIQCWCLNRKWQITVWIDSPDPEPWTIEIRKQKSINSNPSDLFPQVTRANHLGWSGLVDGLVKRNIAQHNWMVQWVELATRQEVVRTRTPKGQSWRQVWGDWIWRYLLPLTDCQFICTGYHDEEDPRHGTKAVHKSFANQAKKRFLCYFRLQVKIWKTQNQLPLI